MGFLSPKWLQLHHRVSDRYEQLAFSSVIENDKEIANATLIAGRIIAEELKITPPEGARIALQLFDSFQTFDIREVIRKELIAKGGVLTEAQLDDLLFEMKRRFHDPLRWHVFFLDYVIGYLIDRADLGIERGDYLMRIALGTIPDEKGIWKFAKKTMRFARFLQHEDTKRRPK